MNNEPTRHEGGCLCGAVRYSIEGAPTYAANCHCRSCQKAAGAGFVTWAGAAPDNFKVTKGAVKYAETSKGVQRGFCEQCGSSLTFGGDDWDDIAVTVATLDDPTIAMPRSNVYLSHKQPWVPIDDALKKFAEFP
jgi:hypothetical protein